VSESRPFHLAVPVHDLIAARRFYGEVFGCVEGRSADHWVDFDFFGHQLVTHLSDSPPTLVTNPVDGSDVPVPHFGVVLSVDEWQVTVDRLRGAGISFVSEPTVRFAGTAGEQRTCFLLDPSGNAIELKAFADPAAMFATGGAATD